MARGGLKDFEVIIDAPAWAKLRFDLARFGPVLEMRLKQSIREAGSEVVRSMRDSLRQPPPTGGDSSVGSREAVARSIEAKVSMTGTKGVGIRISADGRFLAPGHEGFQLAYNKKSFRHPVNGSDAWVVQEGRPYFGAAIHKALREMLLMKMELALSEAIASTGAHL